LRVFLALAVVVLLLSIGSAVYLLSGRDAPASRAATAKKGTALLAPQILPAPPGGRRSPPTVTWTASMSADGARSLFTVGDLVLAVQDLSSQTRLLGLDLRTGQLRWQTTLTSAPTQPDPVAAGGVLLVTTDAGVTAVDLTAGRVLWKRNGDLVFPRAISDDTAVLATATRAKPSDQEPSGGTLEGLSLHDGTLKWTLRDPGLVGSGNVISNFTSPHIPVGDGLHLVNADAGGGSDIVSIATGRVVHKLAANRLRQEASVLVQTQPGGGAAAFNIAGGKLWDLPPGNECCLAFGNVLSIQRASDQAVIDAHSGRQLWTTPGNPLAVVSAGVVVSEHDTVAMVDADTGRTVWRVAVAGRANLAISSDVIYVVGTAAGGSVQALDAKTGAPLWSWHVRPDATVTAVPGGLLVGQAGSVFLLAG
jgi:outer membrane protein assembly factor BamB